MNATERILNLALLLGVHVRDKSGVSTQRIRSEIYPENQSDGAFLKMFQRDKDTLRQAGIAIKTDTEGNTLLEESGTFIDIPDLMPAERAALQVAGYAQLSEPLFPLPLALRMALTKLSGLLDSESAPALRKLPTTSSLGALDCDGSSNTPSANHQANNSLFPELLLNAINQQYVVTINYVNAANISSSREINPYGMFLLSGRWYIVGLDAQSDDFRIFKVGRIRKLEILEKHFTRITDFELSDWISLPFQIPKPTAQKRSNDSLSGKTQLIISADRAVAIDGLTRGKGTVTALEDGSFLWEVDYCDYDELISYALEHDLSFFCEKDIDYAAAGLQALMGQIQGGTTT